MCGAIDETLVDIVATAASGGVSESRHGNTSLNVLAICDANSKFLFVLSRLTHFQIRYFLHFSAKDYLIPIKTAYKIYFSSKFKYFKSNF